MRAGAGYVTAFVPALAEPRLRAAAAGGDDGAAARRGRRAAARRRSSGSAGRLERAGALVLGPGIGRERRRRVELRARELAAPAQIPLLLDADGLNAHAGRLESLAQRAGADRADAARRRAGSAAGARSAPRSSATGWLRCARPRALAQAVVVLKGDDTIVAEPGRRAAVSRGGASALATAGTGDVLSGVIGAYLSKRMDPFTAACAGVFVHARAGRLAAARIGAEGVIARDVIERCCRAPRGACPTRRERWRCARWHASTWPRSSATRATAAPGWLPARGCARSSRPTRYGHGAVAGARRAGRRRDDAGGRDRRRGRASCATPGSRRRCWCWARSAPRSCRWRSRAGAELDRLDRAVRRRVLTPARRRAGRGPRQARHRHGAARHALAAEALAVADRVGAGARTLRLAGAMTHFATADGDPEFLAAQLAAFAPFVAQMRRSGARARGPRGQQRRDVREPASHFDMVRCGIALYGCDPMNETPTTTAWSRRWS